MIVLGERKKGFGRVVDNSYVKGDLGGILMSQLFSVWPLKCEFALGFCLLPFYNTCGLLYTCGVTWLD